MNQGEKVSIIIPVYNAQKYLGECLDSVINQTYENIEILCINDGSKDKSLSILNEYKEKDKRINIINKENTGVSKTRNLGIYKAQGNYIIFVDADDKIDKFMIEKMMGIVSENEAEIVVCLNNLIDKNSKERCINIKSKYKKCDNIKKIKKERTFEYLYDLGMGIPIWNKLLKKQFLLENQIQFNENMTYDEDMFFSWTGVLYAKSIHIIDEPLYKYRLTLNSAIMKYHENLFEKYQIEFSKISKIMKEQEFKQEYIDFIIEKIFREKIKNSIFMVIRSRKKFNEKKIEIKRILQNTTILGIDTKNKNLLSILYKKGYTKKNIYLLIVWAKLLDIRGLIARTIK